MGGSQSKAQPTIKPAVPEVEPTGDVYEVPGAGHKLVVFQDPTTEAKDGRYRPASKEAIAYRDATNINADKLLSSNSPNRQTKVLVKDSRDYIVEHEGLMVGDEKRRQLSQQWWFALSSEPLQRGLDAGLILGAVTAGTLVMTKKQYRSQPGKVAFLSLLGFCVGCMSVPLAVVYLDAKNAEKVRQRDRDRMRQQRDEYLDRKPPSF
eukprot:GILJ01030678.1.p1 GENE.GILJ01030678.1~~GILJ01030678.1.p1  ORF type:complete len:207 (+),score=18.35 GILJ01030678.1:86-706(+)